MQERSVSRYPMSFVLFAGFLILVGGVAFGFPHTRVPLLSVFLPSMYLTTLVFEIATFVLKALLFSKARDPSLLALAFLFLLCGLLDAALFLTLQMPGTSGPLLRDASTAPPYLFVTWHAVLPLGALVYVFGRRRWSRLAPPAVEWFMGGLLPLATLGCAFAVIALVIVAAHLPAVTSGTDLSAFRQSWIAFVDIPLTLAALVAIVWLAGKPGARGVDFAVALAVLSSLIVVTISVTDIERYSVAWFTARLFYLVGSSFVLIASIRDLLAQYDLRLQNETDVLRREASTYEQNIEVEASIVKSRFVAAVSHELRTPLGGIIGMAELLDRSELSEKQRYCTAAIRGSADTLLRVVNDLLDFSRAESGRLEIEEIPFDLASIIDEVVMLFREQAKQKGVSLHLFIDPVLPATVTGDPTRLKQVLQNLLNNAVRFTSVGSIRVDVRPEPEHGPASMIRFAVHDTGIGIARGAQDRIFKAFTQEDASTARLFGGTGLGLAIARHLVQLMGGRITVNSVVGVGSTFMFTIPFRAALAPGSTTAPLRNKQALLIENDAAIRALLEQYAEGWQMRFQSAASIAEARIATTLSDPQTSGWDVLVVGPSVDRDEATRFVSQARSNRLFAGAAFIIVEPEHCRERPPTPGFDASVHGPLRQSPLFDAIVHGRRHEYLPAISAPATGAHEPPSRAERILVAEDNEVNRALLVAQLEHLGFQPDVVDDGLAAVEAAVARPYDLIFMDCQMPRVDGFEAARRIRSSAKGAARTPIVAVTANVLPGYREVCVAAGMSDYLAKPALIDPLTRIIDRWLPRIADDVPAPPNADDGATPTVAARARLREIFRGDEARVEATIALALRSLNEGAAIIQSSLNARDANGAAEAAHKLKGVAVEVGILPIAEIARTLEDRARADDWIATGAAYQQLRALLDRDGFSEDVVP